MRQIPMLNLKAEYEHMKDAIDLAVKKCFEHQAWILGPEVKELEKKIASYLGAKHCIGVSSGTEALVLSLRALAIKLKGKEYFDKTDEIITTPFTFTATGDAILRAGATPVFVDVDPASYNINPEEIKKYLKSSSKVVGIIPVHLYGRPCDMDAIMEIARERGVKGLSPLFVVEDVAQAFGAAWKGKKAGTIGSAGTFSFFPSKNLGGCGDGGMVATDDDETAGLVTMLLKHGGKDKYNVDHIGYNARLDTLQAAILLAKLGYIDEFNEKRAKIAAAYSKGLSGVKGVALPDEAAALPAGSRHVWHQYTIGVQKRDELQKHLNEKGVSSMIYYPFPLSEMKVFKENGGKTFGALANSANACKTVLSLPVEPLQSAEDTAYVVESVKAFFK